MRKLLSIILVLCIAFTAMPANAQTDGFTTYTVELPETATLEAGEYYAQSLTDFQKRVYRACVDAFSAIDDSELMLKQEVEFTVTEKNPQVITSQEQFNEIADAELAEFSNQLSFQKIYNALSYDHTEFFWLRSASSRISLGATSDQTGTTFEFTVTISADASNLFATDADLQNAAAEVTATVDSIVAGMPADDVAAVEYINKWLADNNTYNQTHIATDAYPLAHTAYSALTSGNVEEIGPVCQGYAYAFKILCDRVGIESVVISGTLYQSLAAPGPHAWNAVNLYGDWYAVDATSNDSLSSNEYSFLAGSQTPSHDRVYTTFATTHVNDSIHDYPALAEEAYSLGGELQMAGANIRTGENAGLRFRTIVTKDALFDRFFETDDPDKTYVYSENNNLMFGTLCLPEEFIDEGATLESMLEANNPLVLDIPAKKIYAQDEETLTFTGVITAIPEHKDAYSQEIVALSYIKYREDESSEWTYIFAEQASTSYYKVAKAARNSDYSNQNNPNPDAATAEIMAQLDDIIKIVEGETSPEDPDGPGWIDGWY